MREIAWWLKNGNDAENLCRKCYVSQIVGGHSRPEPLRLKIIPDYPCQATTIDINGPFLSGGQYWCLFTSLAASSRLLFKKKPIETIKINQSLEETFARYGIPET